MTIFLLIISLLLNGISIYFIFILYSRQNRLLEVEKAQENFKKDIENEISAFLFEMKEQNDVFIKRFQQIKKTPSQEGKAESETFHIELTNEGTQSHINESDIKDWEAAAGQVLKKQAVKAYQQTILSKEERTTSVQQPEEKSEIPQLSDEEIYRDLLINQIKILQTQGLSSDAIAQKLNKGKTEIELLLKFG